MFPIRPKIIFLLCCFCVLDPSISSAETSGELSSALALSVDLRGNDIDPQSLQGWAELYPKLVALKVNREVLLKTLADPRLGPRDPLIFSVNPKEPQVLYRKANTARDRANALEFYREHAHWFKAAEKKYGVSQSIILSLMQIETKCGDFTGRSRVLPGLLRLAAAANSENLVLNYRFHEKASPKATHSQIAARAKWLEQTFLPHAAAVFKVAHGYGVEPLELRGSGAGAVGLPQFLPGNQLRYGIDADQNGSVNLFSAPDAIFSIANFLSASGWSRSAGRKAKYRALWAYNRSDPYITTALTMAGQLEAAIKRQPKTSAPASKAVPAAKTVSTTLKTSAASSIILTGKEPPGYVRDYLSANRSAKP